MQVKTILNRLHKFKSFVYKSVIWTGPTTAPQLEVEVVERANGKPICSECRFPRPGVRPVAKATFRVRTVVGHQSIFGLWAAPRQLSRLWRLCGVHALGFGQTPTDKGLWMVPGLVGKATFLERNSRSIQHLVGVRFSLGGDGC